MRHSNRLLIRDLMRAKMHRTFKRLVALVIVLVWAPTWAYAASPNCEHFKTKAPILDVLKDPRKVGDYVGELQRGDVVCIRQKRKIGRRTWGLVDHIVLEDGKIDKLNGWVGLRFMTPHKLTSAATPPKTTSAPKTAKPPQSAPASAGKSKAEIDREAEIAYWNTVRDSKDPELIASYLSQYPNGTFAKLAKLMLDKFDEREEQAGAGDRDDDRPATKPTRTERKPEAQPRERTVSRPSRDDRRRIEQRRRDRDRADRRRSQRDRAERRRRDRARRAERRREQQARNRRRAERERPRRKRRPRCRMETRFECIKRGGTINSSGDCNVDRICE